MMRKPPRSKRSEHFFFNLSRDLSKCVELLIHPIFIQVINEKIAWLEENADADADELKAQKKEMEDIVQPIITKLYQV